MSPRKMFCEFCSNMYYMRKLIDKIEIVRKIFNSDKICYSYSYLRCDRTFWGHMIYSLNRWRRLAKGSRNVDDDTGR